MHPIYLKRHGSIFSSSLWHNLHWNTITWWWRLKEKSVSTYRTWASLIRKDKGIITAAPWSITYADPVQTICRGEERRGAERRGEERRGEEMQIRSNPPAELSSVLSRQKYNTARQCNRAQRLQYSMQVYLALSGWLLNKGFGNKLFQP